MTHHEAGTLALHAAGGGLLGLLYFGGLWWTLRRMLDSAHPAAWLFGGLIFRLAVAMAGLYDALQSGLGSLAACLAGFIAARMALMRLARPGRSDLPVLHAP